jgi:glyoxylase-like metal-dependent hydrolase (beta-lactamase superfamily II)
MNWSVAVVEVGQIPQLPLSLYLPDAPRDARIDIPCFAYVLRDEDGRVAVVDTGFDPARAVAAGRMVTGDPAAALHAALAAVGTSARQVELVVQTHLHYDHAQNDALFPAAEVVVARRELDHALSKDADPFYDGVEELVARAGDRLRLLEGEEEVVSGIRAVPNGGHTPGHQSLVVETADGPVCVCGDIISLRGNLTGDVGPICTDTAAVRAFAERVRSEGWEPLPGHEPDLRAHPLYLRTEIRA